MTLTPKTEHFNLYYIFKEDKERHILPAFVAEDIWQNALMATKKLKRPPPKT